MKFRICSLLTFSLLTIVEPASATAIHYTLSGLTKAPVVVKDSISGNIPENQNHEFQIQWDGVELVHQLGSDLNSSSDDVIQLIGTVNACVGKAGSSCFGDGNFERVSHTTAKPSGSPTQYGIYAGAGEFELVDVSFSLDASRTTNDDVYANMDSSVGYMQLLDQKIGKAGKVKLSLKQHAELDYAFRLFADEGQSDATFRIYTWLQTQSLLFAGRARGETRRGEGVFNGELTACRIGSSCDGTPETEVPEPTTVLLLGGALIGSAYRRRSTSK